MRYYAGPGHEETRVEEFASVLTHGLGVVLAIAALAMMLHYALLQGDAWHVVTLAIFGASLVAVYLASTLYHAVLYHHRSGPRWRRAMRICDHACIYLLIAGTYTPFMLVTIGGPWGWSIFGVMWALAATGIVLKLRYTGQFPMVSTGIYIAMGWMALACGGQVIEATSTVGLAWLVAGGVAYTGGVAFYLWDHLPFNHAIWHLFVVAGSACHVTAAFYDVLPG
ncbi:hemolysin III family protein [Phycisphaerales bacterium AB-hyl4]|uniref:Hemolysin III family protein n=1 Tax=Natronomicrosphaera hydrolytica TaxID=3242702 RepID=A0ABV4U6M8_9BACT